MKNTIIINYADIHKDEDVGRVTKVNKEEVWTDYNLHIEETDDIKVVYNKLINELEFLYNEREEYEYKYGDFETYQDSLISRFDVNKIETKSIESTSWFTDKGKGVIKINYNHYSLIFEIEK